MPKTIRDEAKHRSARAIKHLLTTSDYIIENETLFRAQHPELADELLDILTFVGASIEGLSLFMNKAWGVKPDDIEKWF